MTIGEKYQAGHSAAVMYTAIVMEIVRTHPQRMDLIVNAQKLTARPEINLSIINVPNGTDIANTAIMFFSLPEDYLDRDDVELLDAAVFLPITDDGKSDEYRVIFRSNWGMSDYPQYHYAVKKYSYKTHTAEEVLNDIMSFIGHGLLEGPKFEAEEADKL